MKEKHVNNHAKYNYEDDESVTELSAKRHFTVSQKKRKKNLSKNIDPSKKCLCFCLCAKLCPSLPLPEVLATSFRLPCRSSPSASKNRLLIPSPHSLPVKTHLGHPLITLFIIHSFCPLLFFFFSCCSSACPHLPLFICLAPRAPQPLSKCTEMEQRLLCLADGIHTLTHKYTNTHTQKLPKPIHSHSCLYTRLCLDRNTQVSTYPHAQARCG